MHDLILIIHIMPALAIVIPAFKEAFLSKTLDSLAMQTNQEFSVYIGNDAGEAGIGEIVNQFNDRLNIHYEYFHNNFGGASLVKQWYRCFALTENEEWIWLLPDDDYADPQCVELFYAQLQKTDFDLFRFNVHFVRADEKIFKTNAALPAVQPAFESLMEKLSFYRPSTVAEFIFNRNKFESIGFTEIPMAWGTDDLLWYSMGKEKGIYGCNDAYVYLRQSDVNISNNYSRMGNDKIAANFILFEQLLQMRSFYTDLWDRNKKQQFASIAQHHILYNLQDFSLRLSLKEMYRYAKKGSRIWGGTVIRNMRWFWLNNKRIAIKKSHQTSA